MASSAVCKSPKNWTSFILESFKFFFNFRNLFKQSQKQKNYQSLFVSNIINQFFHIFLCSETFYGEGEDGWRWHRERFLCKKLISKGFLQEKFRFLKKKKKSAIVIKFSFVESNSLCFVTRLVSLQENRMLVLKFWNSYS